MKIEIVLLVILFLSCNSQNDNIVSNDVLNYLNRFVYVTGRADNKVCCVTGCSVTQCQLKYRVVYPGNIPRETALFRFTSSIFAADDFKVQINVPKTAISPLATFHMRTDQIIDHTIFLTYYSLPDVLYILIDSFGQFRNMKVNTIAKRVCLGLMGPNCEYRCTYSSSMYCDPISADKYCQGEYFGSNCDMLPSECSHNICNKNGRCIFKSKSRFECVCDPGFKGYTCQDEECSINSCGIGNACFNTVPKITCICQDGRTGEKCDIPICTDTYCNGKGTCSLVSNEYLCTCQNGFTGKQCEYECPGTCQNDGKCELINNQPVCSCTSEFVGNRCQFNNTNVDLCDFIPCQNGGVCESNSTANTYTCTCPADFIGFNCQRYQFPAHSCVNGQVVYGKGCKCNLGYKNNQCSQPTCDALTCQNEGTCKPENNKKCVCKNQFAGDLCEYKCPLTCDNGFCDNADGYFKCTCNVGFIGETCNIEISKFHICDTQPCQNQGKCMKVGENYTCECSRSWSGKNCEISSCSLSNCLKGVCIIGLGCSCFTGSSKENCVISTSLSSIQFECNGYKSIVDHDQRICMCPRNEAFGLQCQFKCNLGCSETSSCVLDSEGLFNCECDSGYYGETCSRKQEFYDLQTIAFTLCCLVVVFLILTFLFVFLIEKHRNNMEKRETKNAMFDPSNVLNLPERIDGNVIVEDIYSKEHKVLEHRKSLTSSNSSNTSDSDKSDKYKFK